MAAQRPAPYGPDSTGYRPQAPAVRRDRVRRAVGPLAAATLLLLAFSPEAGSAATVTATWQARLGTGGTDGSATGRLGGGSLKGPPPHAST